MKELRMTNKITEYQNKQRSITTRMFSILLMNRELEWCLFNSKLNIAQNEINIETLYKDDFGTNEIMLTARLLHTRQ